MGLRMIYMTSLRKGAVCLTLQCFKSQEYMCNSYKNIIPEYMVRTTHIVVKFTFALSLNEESSK